MSGRCRQNAWRIVDNLLIWKCRKRHKYTLSKARLHATTKTDTRPDLQLPWQHPRIAKFYLFRTVRSVLKLQEVWFLKFTFKWKIECGKIHDNHFVCGKQLPLFSTICTFLKLENEELQIGCVFLFRLFVERNHGLIRSMKLPYVSPTQLLDICHRVRRKRAAGSGHFHSVITTFD